MIQINLFTNQKQTYKYKKKKNKLIVIKGETWGGGISQEHGSNIHILM